MRYKRRMNPGALADLFRVTFWTKTPEQVEAVKWITRTGGKSQSRDSRLIKGKVHSTFFTSEGANNAIAQAAAVGISATNYGPRPLTRKEPTVTPRQAQDAAEKLGYHRTSEIVGPGGLSGASMAALVRLVREASRLQNPARRRRRNPHPLPEWAKKLTDPNSYAVQRSHGGVWIQGPQGDLRKSFPSEAAARAYLDSPAHRDYAAKLQNYYAMDPMKGDVARVKLLSGETVEIALKTPSDVHTASELARESGYYIATTPFYDKWARKKAGLSSLTKGQYAALTGGGR